MVPYDYSDDVSVLHTQLYCFINACPTHLEPAIVEYYAMLLYTDFGWSYRVQFCTVKAPTKKNFSPSIHQTSPAPI